jgi:hypothetical protein
MSKYELSNEELSRRVSEGDTLAAIALDYRLNGKQALIDDLNGDEAESRMESMMLHGCE